MVYSQQEIAQRIKPIAEKYGISEVYLFGSHARKTASATSDVDVLIKRSGSKIRSAFDLGGILLELQEALDRHVDLVTIESLDPKSKRPSKKHFSDNLDKEKVLIYEKR